MSRHRAKKSLGQNFLVDPATQRRIVEALGAGPADAVLEVGPGRGALTRHLVGSVRHLTVVELDDRLARELQAAHAGREDVTVLHGDILAAPLSAWVPEGTPLVIGNIPYNITTPILFHLLRPPRPPRIVLMVQAEVADRLAAAPGGRAYGALSVGVRSVASVERLFTVRRGAFRPVPRVDSAVVRIVPHDPPPLAVEEEEALRRVVRAAFQWRRKQMGKILRDHPDLGLPADRVAAVAEEAGFRPSDRPENLAPETFLRLARVAGWGGAIP